jgi:hypothetical protein
VDASVILSRGEQNNHKK